MLRSMTGFVGEDTIGGRHIIFKSNRQSQITKFNSGFPRAICF